MRTTGDPSSLAAEAYSIVRRRILRGELAMGQVISRRKLAAELGMSFLPVSEALLRLECEGLLESRPRAGTRIRIPSKEDVRGHYVVREALEMRAAMLFAERATPEKCADVMKLAARVDAAGTQADAAVYSRLQHKLHRRIAEGTDCPALAAAIDRTNALSVIWLCTDRPSASDDASTRHQDLAKALCGGYPEGAAEAMRQYLAVSLQRTLDCLKPYFRLRMQSGRTYARSKLVATVGLLLAMCASPAFAQERVDAEIVGKIRAEGLQRSKALEIFSHLTTVIGPRLTASPAHRKSIEWTQEQLRAFGLANVGTEPFQFGRGWTLERFSIEMVEPRYMPLIGFPRAWSPSTAGKLSNTAIWLGDATPETVAAKAGSLKGAIVLTSPIQEYFIRADRPPASGDLVSQGRPPARLNREQQQQIASTLRKSGVGVVLEPNIGEHGTIFVTGRDGGADSVPTVVLASEHYNLIGRLLARNIPVKLSVDVQARFHDDDTNAYNVIAELPGVDPAIGDEVVMVGAHLDSWHSAAGATDNADGVTTAMEALRILKAIGVKPRRTIRIALWAGEEQGLLGSRAWVQKHLAGDSNRAARDKFSVYFNLDNGIVPISGFYLEGNAAMGPIMEAWLKPFADLGATIATQKGIGSTDHLSFRSVGVPGFQAVQNYRDYDVRTHHTNMDTDERVPPDALKQASVVMASILYHAAMRDEKIPRGAARESSSPAFRARLSVVPIDLAMQAAIAGAGSVEATLTGSKLEIAGTFEGLKSPASLARVHIAPRGMRGPSVVDLTVSNATSGSIKGSIDLTPAQVKDLLAGNIYIQLHSEKAPEGNLWGWLLARDRR